MVKSNYNEKINLFVSFNAHLSRAAAGRAAATPLVREQNAAARAAKVLLCW